MYDLYGGGGARKRFLRLDAGESERLVAPGVVERAIAHGQNFAPLKHGHPHEGREGNPASLGDAVTREAGVGPTSSASSIVSSWELSPEARSQCHPAHESSLTDHHSQTLHLLLLRLLQ
jgi:hypothetical protein